ncbi:membrane protein insertion efficiency factor YidD [Methylopila musalis]|uniref:Putative membrane protein insertion efficiency factor n=1 Tax=Methylopila musalis TaxID=1134781 RepID=A0ABW3ZA69_9HYPH
MTPGALTPEPPEVLGPGSRPGQGAGGASSDEPSAPRSPAPALSFRAPLASALRLPILGYRYSLSLLIGRHCRYLPSCSEYADEAIARHGAWAGGWMAAGRVCRCHPWGPDGYDPVPNAPPPGASWSRPWRYARRPALCEAADDGRTPQT